MCCGRAAVKPTHFSHSPTHLIKITKHEKLIFLSFLVFFLSCCSVVLSIIHLSREKKIWRKKPKWRKAKAQRNKFSVPQKITHKKRTNGKMPRTEWNRGEREKKRKIVVQGHKHVTFLSTENRKRIFHFFTLRWPSGGESGLSMCPWKHEAQGRQFCFSAFSALFPLLLGQFWCFTLLSPIHFLCLREFRPEICFPK